MGSYGEGERRPWRAAATRAEEPERTRRRDASAAAATSARRRERRGWAGGALEAAAEAAAETEAEAASGGTRTAEAEVASGALEESAHTSLRCRPRLLGAAAGAGREAGGRARGGAALTGKEDPVEGGSGAPARRSAAGIGIGTRERNDGARREPGGELGAAVAVAAAVRRDVRRGRAEVEGPLSAAKAKRRKRSWTWRGPQVALPGL